MRPVGVFFTQNMAGERSKKHTKNNVQKSKKICQKCAPKRYPEKWSFCGFSGPGAKGVPGWSQRPPRAPYKSNLVEICTKKGARNWISVMFYWVLSQTEPTCPQVLLRCFQMFPDASRVLIRVISGGGRQGKDEPGYNPDLDCLLALIFF